VLENDIDIKGGTGIGIEAEMGWRFFIPYMDTEMTGFDTDEGGESFIILSGAIVGEGTDNGFHADFAD
jgi:hypothetical protein